MERRAHDLARLPPLGLASAFLMLAFRVTAASAEGDSWNGFDISRRLVPSGSILRGGPPPDGIPTLDRPVFETASEASVKPTELVVGLVAGSSAKAYPLSILNWHEIVEDELDGKRVAVTYCPLTGSAVVFDRLLPEGVGEDRALEFGVSGLLHESNMLMFDRRTSSLWSQLGGGAISGAQAGAKLQAIPSVIVPWKTWRERHPGTLVLSRRTGHDRDYDRDPYGDYPSSDATLFPVSRRDPRLPVKDLVLGVVLDGESLAFPIASLRRAAKPLTVRIAEREVVVDTDAGSVVVDGRTAVSVRAYWFAWAAFHPETSLWTTGGLSRPAGSGKGTTKRPASDVRVSGVSGYWANMGSLFLGTPQASMDSGTALEDPDPGRDSIFVLRGDLENVSDEPIHDIVLSFELLDERGEPVVRLEGFNHLAEPLFDGSPVAVEAESAGIPPGGKDTFRMLFFGDETPPFRGHRVGVVAVH